MVGNRELLVRLLEAGYEPTMIAQAADMPLDDVMDLMPTRSEHGATDAQIQAGIRQLAARTIEEAFHILDEGSYPNKMKLILKFGGDMLRILGHGDKDENEELRGEFAKLMEQMR